MFTLLPLERVEAALEAHNVRAISPLPLATPLTFARTCRHIVISPCVYPARPPMIFAQNSPEARGAQRLLAEEVTELVHGRA